MNAAYDTPESILPEPSLEDYNKQIAIHEKMFDDLYCSVCNTEMSDASYDLTMSMCREIIGKISRLKLQRNQKYGEGK